MTKLSSEFLKLMLVFSFTNELAVELDLRLGKRSKCCFLNTRY